MKSLLFGVCLAILIGCSSNTNENVSLSESKVTELRNHISQRITYADPSVSLDSFRLDSVITMTQAKREAMKSGTDNPKDDNSNKVGYYAIVTYWVSSGNVKGSNSSGIFLDLNKNVVPDSVFLK